MIAYPLHGYHCSSPSQLVLYREEVAPKLLANYFAKPNVVFTRVWVPRQRRWQLARLSFLYLQAIMLHHQLTARIAKQPEEGDGEATTDGTT
jgi:hypothetical protein